MVDMESMSPAAQAAARRYLQRKARHDAAFDAVDLRAEGEDDDGYDPYSDFMDAQSRSMREEPSEDPWR